MRTFEEEQGACTQYTRKVGCITVVVGLMVSSVQ